MGKKSNQWLKPARFIINKSLGILQFEMLVNMKCGAKIHNKKYFIDLDINTR